MNQKPSRPDEAKTADNTPENLGELFARNGYVKPKLKTTEANKYRVGPDSNTSRWYKLLLIHLINKARDAGTHDWLMVIFTGVLTIVAVLQVCLVYQNYQDSTQQMGKVIDAVNRIEDAGDSFSASSANISRSMTDAVVKLNKQATATQTVADQALAQTKYNRTIADSALASAAFGAEERLQRLGNTIVETRLRSLYHDVNDSFIFDVVVHPTRQEAIIEIATIIKPSKPSADERRSLAGKFQEATPYEGERTTRTKVPIAARRGRLYIFGAVRHTDNPAVPPRIDYPFCFSASVAEILKTKALPADLTTPNKDRDAYPYNGPYTNCD